MTLLNNHRWKFTSEKKNNQYLIAQSKEIHGKGERMVEQQHGPLVCILQILKLCITCLFLLICWMSLQKSFLGWLSPDCSTCNDVPISLLVLKQTRHLLRVYHNLFSVCVPRFPPQGVQSCVPCTCAASWHSSLGPHLTQVLESNHRCCIQSECNLYLCNSFCYLIFS